MTRKPKESAPKLLSIGDPITIRLPANTPVYVLDGLNHIKSQGSGQFSRIVTPHILQGLKDMLRPRDNTITVNIPKDNLSAEQIEWIESPVTQKMIVQLLLQSVNGNMESTFTNAISNTSEVQEIDKLDDVQTEDQKPSPQQYNDQAKRLAESMWEDQD